MKLTVFQIDKTKERGQIGLINYEDRTKKVAGCQSFPPPGALRVTALKDSGMTRSAFLYKSDNILLSAVLCYMVCTVDGSLHVLNGQHGTETCLKLQNMRLADNQELEDWQECCYVDILKHEMPGRVQTKVAGVWQVCDVDSVV